jgi:nucleoside-diphosphate-sugar epimerase/phosphoheptose isomerase
VHELLDRYFTTLADLLHGAEVTNRASKRMLLAEGCEWVRDAAHKAHRSGNKIIFVGNGGSAAIASHLAIDFSNGGLRALTLSDASALTCIGNDLGYENVFAKQLDLHARPGDLLVAISSSGKSSNILNAVDVARAHDCGIVTFSGFSDDNALRSTGDVNFYIRSQEYGFVEVAHLALGHAMIDIAKGWGRRPRPLPLRSAVGAMPERVLVTGGAGYVGSNLVPKLLRAGYEVTVLDLYIYGEVFAHLSGDPKLTQITGDLRNPADVRKALRGCDAVIHLACISNDPSFDLNPELGRSINFDCFRPLVRAAKEAGVKRFIYASSSSVYGIKGEVEVTENLPLAPLTDYSKYKAMCEEVLEQEREPGFIAVTLRPATVCGYAPRLRLDLTVNILTNHAINNGRITVFGGDQLRPNIHIEDMTDLYLLLLEKPDEAINGKIWNAGYHNLTVREIADLVRAEVSRDVDIVVAPTDDHRSYHVSSEKIRRDIGFVAGRTVEDAISDLKTAFGAGKVPNSMTDVRYYNIKRMQALKLR